MKSSMCVDFVIPTIDNQVGYLSNNNSLRDYDIAMFDPAFPYLERVSFSGDGSCLTIEATERISTAVAHWAAELQGALQSGKTVFLLLNEVERELVATGSSMKSRDERIYNTVYICNYNAIPIAIAALGR